MIEIEDCTTTLLFPFVTTKHGFDTGLVLTNASEGSGSCTIGYSSSDGSDAPADMMTPEDLSRVGNSGSVFCQRLPPDSRAIVTASCEFRDAHGFAFITGGGPPATVAQGYLAVCTNCDD